MILDPATIRDPAPGTPDRVYTDRGYFVEDFRWDFSDLDLPAGLLTTTDPGVALLLEAGRQAWASAPGPMSVDRGRAGVILGTSSCRRLLPPCWCDGVLDPCLRGRCPATALPRPMEEGRFESGRSPRCRRVSWLGLWVWAGAPTPGRCLRVLPLCL